MKRGIKKALFYDISYNTVLMKSWVIKLIHPTPLCTLWQHEGEMSRGSIEDTALIVQKQTSSDWLRWHEDDDFVCAHKTLEGAAFTPVRERATFPTLTLNIKQVNHELHARSVNLYFPSAGLRHDCLEEKEAIRDVCEEKEAVLLRLGFMSKCSSEWCEVIWRMLQRVKPSSPGLEFILLWFSLIEHSITEE